MKLVIAQMKHETNTYSPVPTPLARFALGGGTPPEGEAARSRVPRHRLGDRRVHRARRTRRRRVRGADRRQPPGRAARWTTARSSTSRSASAARWRKVATACCSTCTARWSRSPRRRRRRAAAPHPRDRAGRADRGRDRHAHEPVRRLCARTRQRDRRLPDLPAHRHVRDRPARRPRAARATAAQGRADDGVGPPADAAARDAPGQRRFAQPRAAGALQGDGGARRVVRQRVRRLSERRHRVRRPVGGGRHRRRPGAGAPLVRRAARDGVVAAREVRLRGRAARRIDGAAPRRSPTPSRPAAARWCCSTTATTAPRAARWTR